MKNQEFERCAVCGKTGILKRKYYKYNIKCDCHSPEHFELVLHCPSCVPKPPETTTVFIKPIN